MRVILTQDVEGLGTIGNVVDVAQGYANNYLIPRKLAVAATPGNLKHWEEKKTWILKREAATRAEAEEIAKQLEGAKVIINARVGEEGRLYGSVGVKDIAEEIERDLRVEVDRKKIKLPEPIKSAGDHEVTIHLYQNVEAKLTVSVVGEEGPGSEAPQAGTSSASVAEKDAGAAESETPPSETSEPETAASAVAATEETASEATEETTEETAE
ncbi:MAG: 50S ribosomal protein L9 [Actinobacteria bacterium]|nr:MAG: 50S ribosomal protein L9 [Actinomycetota bacterium]